MTAAERLIQQGRAEGTERGRVEGRAEGMRDAIKQLLAARSIPVTDAGRAQLAACADVATLTQWLLRAINAAHEGEVFSQALATSE